MFEFTLVENFQKIKFVSCPSESDYKKLKSFFKKKRKGYYMNAMYRAKVWDGNDHFFNDIYLPIGLWGELDIFMQKHNYKYKINGLDTFLNFSLNKDLVFDFINDLFENTPIAPRWYQYESIYRILKYRYSCQQLSTSSGKTMISYSVLAYLKFTEQVHKKKKFVLIVPKASLVKQTYDKFVTTYNNGTVKLNIMKLGGGTKFDQSEYDECDALISTYQSLNNINSDNFKLIGTINVDEGHTAKTETISRVIQLSSPLRYRFGLSGTLMVDMNTSDYYFNLQQLGPMTFIYDPKDLIDDGFAPNVKVIQVYLDYSNLETEPLYKNYISYRDNKPPKNTDEELAYFKNLYKIEKDIMVSDTSRLSCIIEYISNLDKNTLVLYNDIKGEFGKKIHKGLLDNDRVCKYIDGSTSNNDRYIYTDELESSDNMDLVASFGTFSTGIDLKNVHYIGLAESFKSPILIGQSIGRGLREFKDKKDIVIIDFIDTMFKHTMNQSKDREKLYKTQKYEISKETIYLKL